LGYIHGKEIKMKEKNKKGGLRRGRLPPYPVRIVALWPIDAIGIDLLASPSTGVVCCGHASSYVPLCRRGRVT
jgi:hypothetical protein